MEQKDESHLTHPALAGYTHVNLYDRQGLPRARMLWQPRGSRCQQVRPLLQSGAVPQL
jgi:hypothetical protein